MTTNKHNALTMTAIQTKVRILQGFERPTRQQLDRQQARLLRLTDKHNANALELMQAQEYLDEKYKELESSAIIN